MKTLDSLLNKKARQDVGEELKVMLESSTAEMLKSNIKHALNTNKESLLDVVEQKPDSVFIKPDRSKQTYYQTI